MENEKSSKNGISKYVNIALILLILLFGFNKFTSGGSVLGAGNENLSKLALEYYLEKNSDQVGQEGLEAIVKNYGCHSEIHIFKNGELVMRTGYSGGQVYEIN